MARYGWRLTSEAVAEHYDRVTAAWGLLLGEDLHYGVFEAPDEALEAATARLTELVFEATRPAEGFEVLDVGCGTGAPAVAMAGRFGARVTGITTSAEGVGAAQARAVEADVGELVRFERRDGMDTGFPDASFDRVFALESSHLMPRRDELASELARVLRPGGRVALCDIVRRRELDHEELRRLLKPLVLLRDVFGDARMEPLAEYHRLFSEQGLEVDVERDLTAETRPTFAAWRERADLHRDDVIGLLGEDDWQKFRDSTAVLERFWDDGTLGYGLIAAEKPAA